MRRHTFYRNLTILGATLWLSASSHWASALQFEFINKGAFPLSSAEMAALEKAAALWQDQFTDPITVKVNVDWQKPDFFHSPEILASVQLGRTTAPLAMVKHALLAEADLSESTILSALPAQLPLTHSSSWLPDVSLTLANAKALGITPANDPRFGAALKYHADAHISFNLKYQSDYFLEQSAAHPHKYDFTGIALHELAHVLGFTSIVDVQSMNPGILLNPMLLDVFRFPSALATPSLHHDSRETLAAWAKFDDTLAQSPFASGYALLDPTHCALGSTQCTASHWSDKTSNLMTSIAKAQVKSIQADDSYALDRIGIDSKWRNGIPLQDVRAEFYPTSTSLPAYDKTKFDTKTVAPAFSSFSPNFNEAPTHAFHLSFDGHAAAGYAVLVDAQSNHKIPPVNFDPNNTEIEPERQWEGDSRVEHMPHFPAHFSHFYFFSKNNRYRFHFISTFSNYGAIFDPTLGEYGGFRISGFLNGDFDGDFSEYGKYQKEEKEEVPDYDATLTLNLLLQKPHNIKDGIAGVPFSIEWPGKKIREDNILHLIDNQAFDAPSDYNNSSSYQEAWEQRVNQLMNDPEPGRDIAI